MMKTSTFPAGPRPADRTALERIKISCLAKGIRIDPSAFPLLDTPANGLLSIHEYATTGGITLELPLDVYVNAPFDGWFAGRADVLLEGTSEGLCLRLG